MKRLFIASCLLLSGCQTLYRRAYYEGYQTGYALSEKWCDTFKLLDKAELETEKEKLAMCQEILDKRKGALK